jgi:hypothetical protein
MDGLSFGFHKLTRPFTLCDARKVYDYPLMGHVGYTRDTADTVIRCGAADAISLDDCLSQIQISLKSFSMTSLHLVT